MTAAVLEALDYDVALTDAMDKVQAEKGLTFRARPAYMSPVPAGTNVSNVRTGSELLGLPVTPQGVMVAGMLEAKSADGSPLYDEAVVEIPRRSTKTTTIQLVLLGRCANTPGYRVVSTAQDGTRASGIMQNMMTAIEMHLTKTGRTLEDVGIRQMYRSQGREYILWENGSKWWVVKPEPSAFRSDAADCMLFDEAGELAPDKADALQAGALPLMDTRENSQIIVAGTPAEVRAGLLWDYLKAARDDPASLGIVDFTAGDFADADDEDTLWATHPGLAAGLTTIAKLRKRREKMSELQYLREYWCVWPPDSTVTALDLRNWDATGRDHVAAPPDVPWAIGWDVAIGGQAGAVAVAWFDDDDEPHVQVMAHRNGSGWMPAYIAGGLLKYQQVHAGYDNIGENIAVAQALGRMEKLRKQARDRIKPLNLGQIAAGTAVLAQANELLTLHHAKHGGLDSAVRHAAWRESQGKRLFMRLKGQEITCLMACTHALAAAAQMPRRRSVQLPGNA